MNNQTYQRFQILDMMQLNKTGPTRNDEYSSLMSVTWWVVCLIVPVSDTRLYSVDATLQFSTLKLTALRASHLRTIKSKEQGIDLLEEGQIKCV